ncbi:TPA: IS1 family transposase, partial [Escherichia coli]
HNLNLRQHLARLGRKSLSFSKSVALHGVRLENGKYPTLSLFFVQIASRVYGDS